MSLLKYISVFLASMVKFVVGSGMGIAGGLSVSETVLFSVLGMMTSVLLFSSLGDGLRRRFRGLFRPQKVRVFTQRNRRLVRIWRRYGLLGIAFLTPVLLSPVVGTLIATSFGESPRRVVAHMLVSALFWGIVLSLFFLLVEQRVSPAGIRQ